MAKKITWKTKETGIDPLTRTVVVEEDVTETKVQEFSLESKYNEIAVLERLKADTQNQIDALQAEIDEIKAALGVDK